MIRKPWSYINQQASLTRGYTRDSYFSLQITQVLMFPVNTIIAWYVNIYHKCEDMIITTLLLPLGHISNTYLLEDEQELSLGMLDTS
jgi:hypothetical protein